MIQQVTKGIKISVQTHFEGMFFKDQKMRYAFGYRIRIENQSQDQVQLKTRFWKIKDALNKTETVYGDGVIGQQPVLKPGESHSYESGCLLAAPFGAMNGYYEMYNFNTSRNFKAKIPVFRLNAVYALN